MEEVLTRSTLGMRWIVSATNYAEKPFPQAFHTLHSFGEQYFIGHVLL